jgi:hypothetical protein
METIITKGSVFGSLDVASDCTTRASENLQKILDNPNLRLRKEDIKRANGYKKLILANMRNLGRTLKEFDKIAVYEKN